MRQTIGIFLLLLLFVAHEFFGQQEAACEANFRKSGMKEEFIEDFQRLAESNELSALLKNNGTINIEFPTFGGQVFWKTYESCGWKLQVNVLSGWWRILDSGDIRRARGTNLRQLQNLLKDHPTSTLSNYFDKGYRFVKTAAVEVKGRSAILVHGWGVRANSMQGLANALAHAGYDAYSYDYPSSEHSIAEHVDIFAERLRDLMKTFPGEEKLFVLTHSMGGLIIRGALAKFSETECRRITCIVMLGPPNRGSVLAYFGELPGMRAVNASLGDMTPENDSYAMTIPPPAWLPPVGIIAGKYDGKVAEKDTHLPGGFEYSHIVVPCSHPGLRSPENTMDLIINFFAQKAF